MRQITHASRRPEDDDYKFEDILFNGSELYAIDERFTRTQIAQDHELIP